jgi:hypothetical protein
MGTIKSIIARHKNSRPNPAENPAWANCHHDMGFLIDALEQMREMEANLRGSIDEVIDERDALAAQLARAREWMQHHAGCPMNDLPPAYCTCGLTAFLKEVSP